MPGKRENGIYAACFPEGYIILFRINTFISIEIPK